MNGRFALALRGGQLRHRALRRRLRRPGAGAAAREPSRFLVRQLRQERHVAVGLPGRRQGISRHRRRPCRGRHGDRRLGQQYIINANWKLLAENSIDGYPRPPDALDLLRLPQTIGSLRNASRAGDFNAGGMQNLGNGHAVIIRLALGPADRALGAVVGRRAKREIDAQLRAGLISASARSAARASPSSDRNMLIFPNLVINDIMAITVRTFMPVRRRTRWTVSAWALGARDEDRDAQAAACSTSSSSSGRAASPRPTTRRRWRTASAATATCARSAGTTSPSGMPRNGPPMNDDEEQMRCFWRQWNQRMGGIA